MALELNQQNNNLIVNGYLRDKNLQHRTFNNTDTIMGTVDVAFNEDNKVNVQRINVFASQYTRRGKENPSYKSIAKVESEFKTGKGTDGDHVHVTGRLDYNIFKTKNGDLVKTLRKNGAFFSRVADGDDRYPDQARAHVILTVTGYEDEIKDGQPTGNKLVHNVNVGYNNRINVIPNLKFNMKSLGNDIGTIVDTFPAGSTVDAQIIFGDYAEVSKQSAPQSHGFGHHVQMSVATKFVHNALIDYLDAEPVSGKQALTAPQMSHAKDLLKQRVAEVNGGGSNNKTPKGAKNPFAGQKERPVSKDEVPLF